MTDPTNGTWPPALDGASTDDTAVTAALFEAVRSQPPLLQAYLRRLPKGADLLAP